MSKGLEAGGGMPLVLLPGTLCDARLFDPLRAQLPARETIVGDMHGAASAAAIASRLVTELPPRFALLGFSLGGIVALEVARQVPDRLSGLALVGANARPVPAADRAARRDAAAAAPLLDRYVVDTMWLNYVADPAHEARRHLIADMARACPRDALAMQTEVAVSRDDARDWIARIDCPTLILSGAEDRINPPELQRELAGGIPGAELVLVPGAGHFVLLERPEASAHAVRRWLAEADRYVPLETVRTKERI